MENTHSQPSEFLDQPAPENRETNFYNPLKDKVFVTGLALLLLSFGSFVLFTSTSSPLPHLDAFFTLNYLLVWVYMIALWANKRLRWWMFGARRADFPVMMLLLMLWLVSCFALNMEMRLFNPSTAWLEIYLAITGIACVAFAWHERMPANARLALWFVLAASLVLLLWFALVLLPVSMFAFLVFWFFGLSFHAFIPLVVCIYLILILYGAARESPRARQAIWAGIAAPLLVVVVFSVAWFRVSSQITGNAPSQNAAFEGELPRWVSVSQQLERNWINGYLLRAVAEGEMQARGMMGDLSMFDLVGNENNPLLQIAALVSPKPDLKPDECRKIYASQYDSRHVMEDRLWSGNDLLTTEVQTRVMLDPAHRLSYTDKVLTVAQKNVGNSGRTATQEAIYTFFLPDGGVVTALSLWIEGKEEPGILTARSRAKEAYTTIVGRERRDPAVVFWQEGNQVRVRVFPVTREMPRQFRIGVTAPLSQQAQTLVYENVRFDGPSALTASERDTVFFAGNGVFAETPLLFKNEVSGTALTYNGLYHHGWSVHCATPPLSRSAFSFDGKNYRLAPLKPQTEPFRPTQIFLDLDKTWTADEVNALLSAAPPGVVMAVSEQGFEPVTNDNITRLLWQAGRKRFSLFPFHKITQPETALVVAKSAGPTPTPAEIADSPFGKALETRAGTPLRVYHIGEMETLSAYLRALQESRDIYCVSGDLPGLQSHLNAGVFPKNPENESVVALPQAGALIVESDSTVEGKAPDHLFRLFAYNKVLRELGGRAGEEEPADLLRLAEQAYIVTPLSSLVTLETQADYERFDIKNTDDLPSLGNAGINGAGSVPEPYEWALIALLSISAWLAWRRKF